MNSIEPWLGLRAPGRAGDLSAKRVEGGGSLDLFWARDFGSRYLLVFHFSSLPDGSSPLPNLKGVDVRLHPPREGGRWTLVIALEQRDLLEVFTGFCQDLVRMTASHQTEEDAVRTMLIRMWRWHHLMRSGRSGLLSEEEQQGLRGELEVLDRLLDFGAPPTLVLDAWQGPLGGVQDFRFPSVAVEVKAPKEHGTSIVSISSESQLDQGGFHILLLALTVMERVGTNEVDGETLPETAERIAKRLRREAPDQLHGFESRLSAAGLDTSQDYSGFHWRLAHVTLFHVTEGFPVIIPSMLPPQVRQVRYSIDLDGCRDFRTRWETVSDVVPGRVVP